MEEFMKIGIASDHRGYILKEKLKDYLSGQYEIIDFGTDSDTSVDYPDYAFSLGESVRDGHVNFGLAICGSGIGICLACNKVKGVRAAKVNNSDEARVTREDNDANILCLSEKIDIVTAKQIVDTFLQTPFSNIERHKRRIQKIKDYEDGNYVR